MQDYLKILFVVSALLLYSCQNAGDEAVGKDGWLTGDSRQKFETVANHLGGFGRAMWEVDYRFQELYWAGRDENWEYAAHQIEELEETLEDGLERRPARAQSAQQFLTVALPGLEEAIEKRSPELFESRFTVLMNTCNSCHVLEEMQFIRVGIPTLKRSSIR
jgi:hypothetical protein